MNIINIQQTWFIILKCAFIFILLSCKKDKDFPEASVMATWKDGAIGAIWNERTATVAYGKKDAEGYYKIYLSDADGGNERQLTFSGWLTARHQWAEEWHPFGKYLFCYVEKADYASEEGHNRIPDDAVPGYGGYTDIWLISRDGSQAWQLTNLANDYNHGILHGAVSADGCGARDIERRFHPHNRATPQGHRSRALEPHGCGRRYLPLQVRRLVLGA